MDYMNSVYEPCFYDVSGTPYEQGLQQGRAMKEKIEVNLKKVYRKMEDAKVDEKEYRAFLDKNVTFFINNRPDMYEELKGISEGSGLPLDEILLLNIPAYFLAERFSCITQECSMMCVRGDATADGGTYVIKNRDMGNPAMDQVMVRHTYPDGSRIIEVCGAGTLTFPAVGINNDGLAVTTTGFWSPNDPTHTERVETADIFLNVRVLLTSCKTAAQAVEFCRTAPRMNGLNVIVADKNEAYAVEMTADDIYVEKAGDKGVIYRTNHMVSDKFSHLNEDPELRPSTHMRYKRIGEMVDERLSKGKIRFQDLLRIMSDHKYEPNCLCRHPHDDVLARTVSTTICSVDDLELWTSVGNMCTSLPHACIGE